MRHGQHLDEVRGNDWPKKGQAPNYHDPPLTDKGRAQAELAAAELAELTGNDDASPLDVVYCSPAQRCVATVACIQRSHSDCGWGWGVHGCFAWSYEKSCDVAQRSSL